MPVDTHVPIPKTRQRPKPPWDQMTPGTSVFFPLTKRGQTGSDRALTAAASKSKLRASLQAKANRYFGARNYVTRFVTENSVDGFRVWRK